MYQKDCYHLLLQWFTKGVWEAHFFPDYVHTQLFQTEYTAGKFSILSWEEGNIQD